MAARAGTAGMRRRLTRPPSRTGISADDRTGEVAHARVSLAYRRTRLGAMPDAGEHAEPVIVEELPEVEVSPDEQIPLASGFPSKTHDDWRDLVAGVVNRSRAEDARL